MVAFTRAAKTGRWTVIGTSLTGECEGVSFAGERRWWGGRWTVVGDAPFPVPERVTLFISAEGMEHGFWRDMAVGSRAFDRAHFVFCNTPALLPLIVGRSTIEAISRRAPGQTPISLYARKGRVQTKGTNEESDADAIARHVAIHQALAADHRACIASWQRVLSDAQGRGNSSWPPTGTITSRVGALLVGLTWELPPESRDGAEWDDSYHSLRTELSAYGDRDKPRWSLVVARDSEPATHVIGGRRYRLAGAPSVSFDRLAPLVGDADVVSITYGAKLDVAVRGFATGPQLQAACRIVEQLLHAQAGQTAPYR